MQEITNAGIYALIVDEARDNSCREQMSLCVRYVNKMTQTVVERFLGFTPLDNLSADGVATTLIQYLTEIQLPVTSCIAQSYDGAAVMAGVNSGVQVIVRDAAGNPCPYVHCHAHRLNLVLVDVAKQIDWVSDAFGLFMPFNQFHLCDISCFVTLRQTRMRY